MNYITVKNAADIKLAGIKAELDVTDKSINGVTFTDASGAVVRVSLRSYSMVVEVPAPPVMVKRFKVVGEVLGLSVNEIFDENWKADERAFQLNETSADSVKVEEVEVPEGSAAVATQDDIPF